MPDRADGVDTNMSELGSQVTVMDYREDASAGKIIQAIQNTEAY